MYLIGNVDQPGERGEEGQSLLFDVAGEAATGTVG